ncbi:hypothetical protein K438DRAFT_2027553 [Mycena galopus ATCC 62051]|nr:hypothetical protein K438DRAFT_2027553 [Mycena galopus ATCC 62051]
MSRWCLRIILTALPLLRSASMIALRSESDSPPASTTFASLVFPTTNSDSEQPNNGKADLAKTVIEWLFVVIAVILIACLFLRKLFGPRTPHREMLHIPVDCPAYVCTYGAYPGISVPTVAYPLPAHSSSHARSTRGNVAITRTITRGLDLAEGGRRINEDAELELGDKDALPAYDGCDRPPKYASVAARAAMSAEQAPDAEVSSAMVSELPGTQSMRELEAPTTFGAPAALTPADDVV